MYQEKDLCTLCNKNRIVMKNMCRSCYKKNYNSKNRDRINEKARKWSKEHRDQTKLYARTPKAKFQNIRSSARSRKLSFTITESEYIEIIKSPCYYCEGFFSLPECGGGLDRLDNNLGYDLNNVVSCCTICNRTRNDNWSPEEAKIIIRAGISFRKSKNDK